MTARLYAKSPLPTSGSLEIHLTDPIKKEAPENEPSSIAVLSRKNPDVSPASDVQFQVEHHRAFVEAYMSSMRYGPIMAEHATWTRIDHRLSSQRYLEAKSPFAATLHRDKVLIICADGDSSIVSDELVPDATAVLEGNVEFRHFYGGHYVPISSCSEVLAAIWEFWSD